MNSYELVSAVQWLLEARQSELLDKIKRKNTPPSAIEDLNSEIRDIEDYLEQARKGFQE